MSVLEREIAEKGGRIEKGEEGEVRLVFRERGFSLADLSAEALRELLEYRLVVLVEEGFGEGGVGYYYYVKREEVEKLLSMLGGG